jgi:hypothetical protein
MNALQSFSFENNPVRIQMDEAGEPLFNASDVCVALELSNASKALSDHVEQDDITKREVIDSLGRIQNANYVNESGLYALIFGSQKEAAKRFKKWVTSEVLPSIRRTGKYEAAPQPQPTFSLPNPNFEAAEFMCRMLNLHGSQKLSVVRRAVSLSAPDMLSELPAYSIDAPRTMDGKLVCAEAGSRPSSSATALLKARNSAVSAQAFNKAAYAQGFIDDGERPSSENPKVIRKYKKVSDKGLKYGMNLTHEKAKGSPQPYWFEDSFDELLEILGLN